METALAAHSPLYVFLEMLLTAGLLPVMVLLQSFINLWSGCGVGLALIGVFMFDAIYHIVAVDTLHGVLEAILAGQRLQVWATDCVTQEQWVTFTRDWEMVRDQGPGKLMETVEAYLEH